MNLNYDELMLLSFCVENTAWYGLLDSRSKNSLSKKQDELAVKILLDKLDEAIDKERDRFKELLGPKNMTEWMK